MTIAIAVTGERDFAHESLVACELDALASDEGQVRLFVGDCPTGADLYARNWWHARYPTGLKHQYPDPLVEVWQCGVHLMFVFVADWYPNGSKQIDKSAGPKRNTKLTKAISASKADSKRALAFFTGKGTGTNDCMKKLAAERIRGEWVPA
jgi:hypothetical protein